MSMNDDDLMAGLRDLRESDPGDLMARVLADAALEAGRRDVPQPSEMLTARVLRDAKRTAAGRRRREGWAWGGIAAACAVGLFVGLSDPGGVVAAVAPEAYALDSLSGAYAFQFTEDGQ